MYSNKIRISNQGDKYEVMNIFNSNQANNINAVLSQQKLPTFAFSIPMVCVVVR